MPDNGKRIGITAQFRLFGDMLDPQQVTSRLGINPTLVHAKGDRKDSVPNREEVWQSGTWQLGSGLADSCPLEEHLTALLDVLSPVAEAIQRLLDNGCRADFFCGCFLRDWNQVVTLSPSAIRRIALLGAAITLDIYDDDSEEAHSKQRR